MRIADRSDRDTTPLSGQTNEKYVGLLLSYGQVRSQHIRSIIDQQLTESQNHGEIV